MKEELAGDYDVVVIGGGPAGLNGALMLARARRRVVVIDAGAPRNAPAAAVHGLLGHDGIAPAELLSRGRDEVKRYGGAVVTGEVIAADRDGDGFTVRLTDGRSARARRLLITTGLTDELPAVQGVAQRWGRDVIHCPYCHGWEARDRVIAVLGGGPMSVHQALLFRQLSDQVSYFTGGRPLDGEEAERLVARGISVVDAEVSALEIAGDQITGVRLSDGRAAPCEVVVVGPRMVARAGLLAGLGLRPAEHPTGAGQYIPADQFGRTDVPGVWVAGNVTDMSAQVGASAAAGAMAGAQINADLVTQETSEAVAALARRA